MTELKYGGSDVKIMYGSQEIGGATKLEPGTIFYMSNSLEYTIKNVHLPSTTKNWSNINGINIAGYYSDFMTLYGSIDISGDDFKNLDIEKEYKMGDKTATVSRSTVDGEYRLNVSGSGNTFKGYKFSIKAI